LSAHSQLRTPQGDGEVLAVPPLSDVGRLLEENRRRLAAFENGTAGPFGRSWAELRRDARGAVVEAALQYLGRAHGGGHRHGPPTTFRYGVPLLLAGHQPELYHPGVWVKNFAINGLARAHGLAPVNLIIDSDAIKSTALRVPAPAELSADGEPHLRTVLFDRWTGDVPWEEQDVADAGLFDTFADRAMEVLRPWDWRPLLPEVWADVRQQRKTTSNLGECFNAARRRLELAWGCYNLEVPMSALCRTTPFHVFACHLLANLPRFVAVHNAALHAYRARNGIRRGNQPAADLTADDGWLEAPLWGWCAGDRSRHRLFVRSRAGRIELRAGRTAWPSLPADGEQMVAELGPLEELGHKVRTRAFTTTLFARMLLADLFVHGIGGGKYDEVTDELIRGFYECEPPSFLVLSATLRLPPANLIRGDLAGECHRLAWERRDLHWNPQRHLDDGLRDDRQVQHLTAEKQAWIQRPVATVGQRRERFVMLRQLNDFLRQPLEIVERQRTEELAVCQRRFAAQTVLRRRDHAFCLYPESTLRPFCTQFLQMK
jgi:hypothetical protein